MNVTIIKEKNPVPHGTNAKSFINWVNLFTTNEDKRCRILLAEILLRLEKLKNKT